MNVNLGEVPVITVDKDAKKDWLWDFRALDNGSGAENFLEDGDLVSSLTITPATGITISTPAANVNTNTAVVVWFSFEAADVDTKYRVEAHLVTTDGREDDFPIDFKVTDY